MMKRIYCDYNATTPVASEVLNDMMPYFSECFGNPSSVQHSYGYEAGLGIQKATIQIAELLGINFRPPVKPSKEDRREDPDGYKQLIENYSRQWSSWEKNVSNIEQRFVYTSGSTEALNLAIKGLAEHQVKGHIVTTLVEHKAVLETCQHLESKGWQVTYVKPDESGLVSANDIRAAIRPDTILVSVIWVNNETGVLQPIEKIGSVCKELNVPLLTDATQAVGKVDIELEGKHKDIAMLCFSGHKIYGPKGIGVLYFRDNLLNISAQIHGGKHQFGKRSGTLNVPGIVGVGKACEMLNSNGGDLRETVGLIRDTFEKELLKSGISCRIVSKGAHRSYNVSNVLFQGVSAENILLACPDLAASSGSACTSSTNQSSHVLAAMGMSPEEANSCIRFSFGANNELDDVPLIIQQLHRAQSRINGTLTELSGIEGETIESLKIDENSKVTLLGGNASMSVTSKGVRLTLQREALVKSCELYSHYRKTGQASGLFIVVDQIENLSNFLATHITNANGDKVRVGRHRKRGYTLDYINQHIANPIQQITRAYSIPDNQVQVLFTGECRQKALGYYNLVERSNKLPENSISSNMNTIDPRLLSAMVSKNSETASCNPSDPVGCNAVVSCKGVISRCFAEMFNRYNSDTQSTDNNTRRHELIAFWNNDIQRTNIHTLIGGTLLAEDVWIDDDRTILKNFYLEDAIGDTIYDIVYARETNTIDSLV